MDGHEDKEMKKVRLLAAAVSLIVFAVSTLPVSAEKRRAVVRPAGPTLSLDCKPSELAAAPAEECRRIRRLEGQRLFEKETFGGNGRTCLTCHSNETGTFSPADAQARLLADANDPLFLHDALDDGSSGTSRVLSDATIRVTLTLPSHLTLRDSTATQVTVRRGTPTTKNTPALDVRLMSDLRDATLEGQAAGAIHGHAQSTIEPTKLQLELIAEWEKFDSRFFSDARVMDSATSGVPLLLPFGTTESEKRGRAFFEEILPGASMAGSCAVCHSGPMLNETNRFALNLLGIPKGARIANVKVSERNVPKNPIIMFELHDRGQVLPVHTPDIGVLMSDLTAPGVAPEVAAFGSRAQLFAFANMFKIPTLWGVKHTAPYFHDNSAKDFDQLLEHYNFFFESQGLGKNRLSAQDIEDIKAFMNLL